ncbi:UTP--glucose-1-phosphate uridylyltransferase [Sulfuricurvum sp.]|uniref:galactose-1-phosphate uridylyltransferase n=1 Tax=Sulfuricurvum sp. TaxID=2025608 RepID=UPI002616BD1B|nr:UTP--glucose-1-phosphate uridylyltransferase [Sulfuricurvum sp.]MDD2781107.1 UTP--glucose-1-phosphate uridylyltransferase [Sulfuricurvum sp.]
MSEIRYDRLHDTHVIIAPERLHRPDFTLKKSESVTKGECPFCEGNEAMTPKEIFAIRSSESFANAIGWQSRVVPNLYKAVAIEASHQHHTDSFSYWDGFGAHEVIIDTPLHHLSMSNWSHAESVAWFKTLRQRVADLRRDHRLTYISLFKNEGSDAGATLEHSHTQLIALPLIPKHQRDLNRRERDYFELHHHALIESILRDEENHRIRMIESQGEFSAFCPYASGYPFEVMISSQKCVGEIDTLSDDSIEQLSILLLSIIQKMRLQLGEFAFNLSISTPPLGEDIGVCEAHRLVIRILPRIYRFGGFEVSSEMLINPVAPELAAKLLRGEKHG